MILKDVLGLISPKTPIFIKDVDSDDILNKNVYVISQLEMSEFIDCPVYGVDPENCQPIEINEETVDKCIIITIDHEKHDDEMDMTLEELGEIQDIIIEELKNNSNLKDVDYPEYHQRKHDKLHRLASKLENVIGDKSL